MTNLSWPTDVDVILPILDGWTPITRDDLDLYQDVITKIQEVLGAGYVDVLKTFPGPKAGNDDVADRLNTLLDPDGGMKGIAFVTGSIDIGRFSEDGEQGFIAFGKDMPNFNMVGKDAYMVIFDA